MNLRKRIRRLNDRINRRSNNSFERSANSGAVIRETWMLDALNARPLNSVVMQLRIKREAELNESDRKSTAEVERYN